MPPAAPGQGALLEMLVELRYFWQRDGELPEEKEDQTLMTELRKQFEKFKADLRSEGRTQGKAEGRAEALLAVLAARGVEVDDAVRAQILSCRDLSTLDRWLSRAATASSASAILSAA